jgi:hypothetical protein
MMDFVSWDDEIPNIWKHQIPWFQTTNQPIISIAWIILNLRSQKQSMTSHTSNHLEKQIQKPCLNKILKTQKIIRENHPKIT